MQCRYFSSSSRPVDANVHIQAPDTSVDAIAPANPVEAPSSAPFQSNLEDNETFAPARPVDAHSAPL